MDRKEERGEAWVGRHVDSTPAVSFPVSGPVPDLVSSRGAVSVSAAMALSLPFSECLPAHRDYERADTIPRNGC
jgi:hypothetical protein